MINKTRVKKEKDALQKQLDALMGKYSTTESELNRNAMSEQDNALYLALDSSIQLYYDMLSSVTDTVIKHNY